MSSSEFLKIFNKSWIFLYKIVLDLLNQFLSKIYEWFEIDENRWDKEWYLVEEASIIIFYSDTTKPFLMFDFEKKVIQYTLYPNFLKFGWL